MIISNDNLIGLPVYTKSGQNLGQIYSFEIDCDTQGIINYHVHSSNPIKNIIQRQTLVIHHSQVIDITSQRMIVDDNLEPETLKVKFQKIPAREMVGVASKQG